MRRLGRHAGVALDHAVLHFDCAAHRVDHAAELDDDAVAGALDDAPVMGGDGGVDQIAAQRPEPRQRALLVRAGEPAIADDIRDQDRRNFPGLAHGARPHADYFSTRRIGSGHRDVGLGLALAHAKSTRTPQIDFTFRCYIICLSWV